MSWSSCVSFHIIHVMSPQNPPKITAVCVCHTTAIANKNTVRSLCELEQEDKSAGGILKNNIHTTIILLAFINVKIW